MKSTCLGILVLIALVAGDENIANDIPTEVNKQVGPYSQQFVYVRGNPELDPSSQYNLLEKHLGRSLIADVIENALNEFRDVVINGNESIPPLDPLVVDHIGPVQLSVTGVRVKANINNLRAEGLQWYVVDNVDFNALRLTFGLHLTLPWLTVTGSYDTEVRLAILLNHKAAGNFRIFLNRFELGVNARLGINILSGHLVLRELNIKIDIHDTQISISGMTGSALLNNAISSLIQNLTQDVIQSEMANVSQMLSEELFDVINDILKDYTLADILG